MSLSNPWQRASTAPTPTSAAAALCSFPGWATHQDEMGRSVWMWSLTWGGWETWPILARRAGAWEAFARPDHAGRGVFDYMLCSPLLEGLPAGEWVDRVHSLLNQTPSGVLPRLLGQPPSPLGWSPSPSNASRPFQPRWREALSPADWGLDQLSASDLRATIVADQGRQWGLWAWLSPVRMRAWVTSVPLQDRWRWVLWWFAARPSDWDESVFQTLLENSKQEPADTVLLPVLLLILERHPSAWLRAQALAWGLPAQTENGSKRSRF